jgi:heme exporter protein D
MSWEATFIGIVAFDTVVVGVGTYVFFKPKWWYIAIGAGTAITGASLYALFKPSWGEAAFVVSAIALAMACVIVLGVSVYVLAKIWRDTLKERRRNKEVKKTNEFGKNPLEEITKANNTTANITANS